MPYGPGYYLLGTNKIPPKSVSPPPRPRARAPGARGTIFPGQPAGSGSPVRRVVFFSGFENPENRSVQYLQSKVREMEEELGQPLPQMRRPLGLLSSNTLHGAGGASGDLAGAAGGHGASGRLGGGRKRKVSGRVRFSADVDADVYDDGAQTKSVPGDEEDDDALLHNDEQQQQQKQQKQQKPLTREELQATATASAERAAFQVHSDTHDAERARIVAEAMFNVPEDKWEEEAMPAFVNALDERYRHIAPAADDEIARAELLLSRLMKT